VFECFSFRAGLLCYQLFVFQTGHRKLTRILSLYQANASTLTLFSKRDKILIKVCMNVKVAMLSSL